ncbi:MAG: hypothetical protein JWM57_2065 [Phycisphaerales bacterium]|nr:hypothetical protein [Phycisphaerales bacterium]
MRKTFNHRTVITAAVSEPLEGRRLLAGHVAAAAASLTKPVVGPQLPKTVVAKLGTGKVTGAQAQGTIADRMTPGGVILRKFTPPIPLPAGAVARKPAKGSNLGVNLGAFDIVLKKSPALIANAAASAAFDAAAVLVESLFSDPITVVVDANIAALGAGILGSTSSEGYSGGYTLIRDAVVNGRNVSDEAVVASLPTSAQFTASLPPSFTLSGNLSANRANLLAVGFSAASLGGNNSAYDPTVKKDMSMTFSTNFAFDYDRSNGISAGQYDFIGVAAHEMLHGLGFVSEVDDIDALKNNGTFGAMSPSTLDLFRLSPGSGQTNFTTSARQLQPNTNAVTYDGGAYTPTGIAIAGLTVGDIPMSTGAFTGDGRQASHFNDNALTGVQIGVMDPTLSSGVQADVALTDIRAMGLIGYETGVSFNSLASSVPDLAVATDTGNSSSDNLTNRDNSTAAKNLQFTVTGTVSGATVAVYSDGTFIGSAVASGASTTVTTNGTVDIADGTHNITAIQTESGKLASAASTALAITVDTIAPGLVSKTLSYLTTKPQVVFTFDTNLSVGAPIPTVVRTSPSPGSVTYTEFLSGTGQISNFSFPSSPNGILPNGRYTATLPTDTYRDAAGNSTAATTLDFFVLAGDANHNATTDFNDFLILQNNFNTNVLNFGLGDFDYSGTIDFNDFLILQNNFNVTV